MDLIVSRVQAFRSMHLHGRALNELLPTAIGDLDDAEVVAKGLESQPAGAPTTDWRIADANTGWLAEGNVKVTGLLDLQAWGRL